MLCFLIYRRPPAVKQTHKITSPTHTNTVLTPPTHNNTSQLCQTSPSIVQPSLEVNSYI